MNPISSTVSKLIEIPHIAASLQRFPEHPAGSMRSVHIGEVAQAIHA